MSIGYIKKDITRVHCIQATAELSLIVIKSLLTPLCQLNLFLESSRDLQMK